VRRLGSQATAGGDDVRLLIAAIAVAVAVVALVADPGEWSGAVLAAVPAAAFALWAFVPRVALWALAPLVLVPVVVAQRDGAFEPLLFEASLLAFVVARWSRQLPQAVALGLLAVAAPVVVDAIQDPPEIAVGIWLVGIAFPWVIARALLRQEQLAIALVETRRELAEQALLAERRRIARDVHDLVGHGLAAVMLQLTSARHVLRRDPAAAEEALRSAEEVGRRSMGELRRTVALLRSDDDGEASAPLPSAGEIPALVDEARAGGLVVELRLRGDLATVSPGVGVAAYRIVQEALANAARHAPLARTIVGVELDDAHLRLEALSTGVTVRAPDGERDGRARYGVIGMRERASALGGELTAGPVREGWRVTCRLPLQPQREGQRA
jgi:signal transduction histidine kinase